MSVTENGDKIENAYTTTIHYLSFYDHVIKLLSYWKVFAVTFITSFGIIWGFFEAIFYSLAVDLPAVKILSASLGMAFLSSLVNGIRSYLTKKPIGFENYPERIQRIVRLKRPYWEYRLAQQLLKRRFISLDKKLEKIYTGRFFIEKTKQPKITEYFDWASLRPTNLIEMVDIGKQLLVVELPNSLRGTHQNPPDELDILDSVESIVEFYRQTIDFEIEGRRIQPPAEFEKLHEIQLKWTMPIRNAANQLVTILDRIANQENIKDGVFHGHISFDQPDNIEEHHKELARLEIIIPDLVTAEEGHNHEY